MEEDFDVSKTPVNPSRTPTQIEQLQEDGQQYFLQICTNLQNKQVVKENQSNKDQITIKNTEDKLKEFNKELIISQSQSGMQLVYNVYNIVPKHYLLLEPIQSWKEVVEFLSENNEFTGFYNCGRESGSSQVRQHIQLLELPEFTPLDASVQNSYLVDAKNKIWQLELFKGYKHGLIKFKSQYEQEEQNDMYDFTYQEVVKAYYQILEFLQVKQIKVSQQLIDMIQTHYPLISELQQIIDTVETDDQEKNKIIFNKSYSLVITNEYLFICLRSKEGYFNSMSFSGYAFAKNQQIAQKIKENGLFVMLKECMVKDQ